MRVPLRILMPVLAMALGQPVRAEAQKEDPTGKRGVETTVARPVKVDPADTLPDRRMMEETATLTGTVRDAETGEPLGASVIPERGWEFSGPDGRFTARFLEPGRQTVRIERRGFLPETRTVELRAGETTTLDVSLRRAAPPCCALTGTWRVRFVMRHPGMGGWSATDGVVEGVLTFADSIRDPMGGRHAPPPNVRMEFGLSDVDFTPFFGERIARDVSTTVTGPTGGNFMREMVGTVFSGDSVEITLIPRISHGGVSMRGRIRDGTLSGKWVQRAYGAGAQGAFEMRREGPDRE
ncbi:MAG TPA: carboxypeptidase-like regulatory domain-containing protein [Longimicrobium sp.]|nr:carboxypeptidase-like regulatory domain-containing protein [Longimicrobium sp.]